MLFQLPKIQKCSRGHAPAPPRRVSSQMPYFAPFPPKKFLVVPLDIVAEYFHPHPKLGAVTFCIVKFLICSLDYVCNIRKILLSTDHKVFEDITTKYAVLQPSPLNTQFPDRVGKKEAIGKYGKCKSIETVELFPIGKNYGKCKPTDQNLCIEYVVYILYNIFSFSCESIIYIYIYIYICIYRRSTSAITTREFQSRTICYC